MPRKLALGLAAAVLLATASAQAANLVNKGGSSDVPTYQGPNRRYLIKAAGRSCPTDFTCFCDTGSTCVLPWSLVTGTVVIDRPGVTLDCQNRMIQPPRYEGSRQQCTTSSQCGQHSSGSPKHACVSGYCQLGGLGGINVGGPFGVDDGSINIDVAATGYVQNVSVVNCKVRNHYAGVVVKGFEGDDGLDDHEVWTGEYRSGQVGISISATDGSEVFGTNVHDNAEAGMDLDYNWSLRVITNHVRTNGPREIYFHGSSARPNRWLDIGANVVASSYDPDGPGWPIGTVLVHDVSGTLAGQCESEGALCDVVMESNDLTSDDNQPGIEFRRSYDNGPTVLLRGNGMRNLWSVTDAVIYGPTLSPDPFRLNARCWTKENTCYDDRNRDGVFDTVGCISNTSPDEFRNARCWY